jgi:hypothetical protein
MNANSARLRSNDPKQQYLQHFVVLQTNALGYRRIDADRHPAAVLMCAIAAARLC